jgi:hypothetical protein
MKHGYTDPRFCTFKQALEKDWHVKKGEHGHPVEFWEVKPGRAGPEDGDDEHRSRLIHRTHTVLTPSRSTASRPSSPSPASLSRSSRIDARRGSSERYRQGISDAAGGTARLQGGGPGNLLPCGIGRWQLVAMQCFTEVALRREEQVEGSSEQ